MAEVSRVIFSGITHTNNLEIQEVDDKNSDTKLTRTGLETGLSLAKQSLDSSGGYVLQANFIYNKDLSSSSTSRSSSNEIKKMSLSASNLSSIGSNWLMRNTASFRQYENQALLINSYQSFSVGSTLGYLNDHGGGSDISLLFRKELHDKVESDQYDITRSRLDLTHYFPHKKNIPYWSIQSSFTKNNANDNARDYFSKSLGLKYNNIKLTSFTGNMGIFWQNDKYSRAVLGAGNITPDNINTPSGGGAHLNNGASSNIPDMINDVGGMKSLPRIADIYYFSLQLGKPLSKSLSLYFGTTLGQYQSSTSDKNEDFYSISSKLSWAF